MSHFIDQLFLLVQNRRKPPNHATFCIRKVISAVPLGRVVVQSEMPFGKVPSFCINCMLIKSIKYKIVKTVTVTCAF